jgi:hypothetical protein
MKYLVALILLLMSVPAHAQAPEPGNTFGGRYLVIERFSWSATSGTNNGWPGSGGTNCIGAVISRNAPNKGCVARLPQDTDYANTVPAGVVTIRSMSCASNNALSDTQYWDQTDSTLSFRLSTLDPDDPTSLLTIGSDLLIPTDLSTEEEKRLYPFKINYNHTFTSPHARVLFVSTPISSRGSATTTKSMWTCQVLMEVTP